MPAERIMSRLSASSQAWCTAEGLAATGRNDRSTGHENGQRFCETRATATSRSQAYSESGTQASQKELERETKLRLGSHSPFFEMFGDKMLAGFLNGVSYSTLPTIATDSMYQLQLLLFRGFIYTQNRNKVWDVKKP